MILCEESRDIIMERRWIFPFIHFAFNLLMIQALKAWKGWRMERKNIQWNF
jgi:hypothetical protein